MSVRSYSHEAPPVVTGKTDDATTFSVFKGWQASANLQARFNPWVEMVVAKQTRDEAIRDFGLYRPGELVGTPKTGRIQAAKDMIVEQLRRRGWSDKMIGFYFNGASSMEA